MKKLFIIIFLISLFYTKADMLKNSPELKEQLSKLNLTMTLKALEKETKGDIDQKFEEKNITSNPKQETKLFRKTASIGTSLLGTNGLVEVEVPETVGKGNFVVSLNFIYRYMKLPPLDTDSTEEIKITDRAINHGILVGLTPKIQLGFGSYGDYEYNAPLTYADLKLNFFNNQKFGLACGIRRYEVKDYNDETSSIFKYYGLLRYGSKNGSLYLNLFYDNDSSTVQVKSGISFNVLLTKSTAALLSFETSQNENAVFSKYSVGLKTYSDKKGYSLSLGIQRDNDKEEWLYTVGTSFNFK